MRDIDNSMFTYFVHVGDTLVSAGRVLADGLGCACIADVAVHRHGKLLRPARILRMNTAMVIWHDPARGIESGLLSGDRGGYGLRPTAQN